MTGVQAVRGMNDALPQQTPTWQHVESLLRNAFAAYGYREIRLPLVEKTELFARSIGADTDIVTKEMYTFKDRNGDSLSLRPEGTASCVRAGIQHGLFHNQQQRLWYIGPMFRHERPQRGRYRQFHQAGVEAVGWSGPDIDAELIALTARLWGALGLAPPTLQINSLGSPQSRLRYRARLVAFLATRRAELDVDSQRRLDTNPLRILDSKSEQTQEVVAEAPTILDDLDDPSREHFAELCRYLDAAGIVYEINPRLMRGLDYYNHTVFEWITTALGAQGTVCAGGRYDGLVELLGGRPVPAAGFAIGLERVVDLLKPQHELRQTPDVFVVTLGAQARQLGFTLGERLRDRGLQVEYYCGDGGLKNQMKRADKSGAAIALLLGEDELESGIVTLKPLRLSASQRRVPLCDAEAATTKLVNESENASNEH